MHRQVIDTLGKIALVQIEQVDCSGNKNRLKRRAASTPLFFSRFVFEMLQKVLIMHGKNAEADAN